MTTPTDRPVSDEHLADIVRVAESRHPLHADRLRRYISGVASLRAQLAEAEAQYDTLRRDVSDRVSGLEAQLDDARRQGAILGEEIERLGRQLAEAMAERDRRELARSAAEKAARMANEVRVAAEQARDRAVEALGRVSSMIPPTACEHPAQWHILTENIACVVNDELAALRGTSARPGADAVAVDNPKDTKWHTYKHTAGPDGRTVSYVDGRKVEPPEPVLPPPYEERDPKDYTFVAPAPAQPLAVAPAADARVYPCVDCGVMRSKDKGGTTFTVCDACWDKTRQKLGCPPEPSGTTGGLTVVPAPGDELAGVQGNARVRMWSPPPDPLLCAAWKWRFETTYDGPMQPKWYTAARDRYGVEALLAGAK